MNFNQLNYFTKVIENRSISKAANALYITQPALSISMHSLEEELGFLLYNKTSKGIEPTSEGLIFYEDAKNILGYIDKWEKIRMEMENKVSVVSIGIVNALYFSLSDAIIMRCCEDYQNIGIALKYGMWDDLKKDFADGKIRILINTCPKNEAEKIKKAVKKIGHEISFFAKDRYCVYINREDELGKMERIPEPALKSYKIVRYLAYNKSYTEFTEVCCSNESVYFSNLNHILAYISKNLHCFALLPSILGELSSINGLENILQRPLMGNDLDNELYFYVQYPGDQSILDDEKKILNSLFKVLLDLFGEFQEDK